MIEALWFGGGFIVAVVLLFAVGALLVATEPEEER